MTIDRLTITGDVAARLTLLNLPEVGPARLSWLLSEEPPESVVETLRRGRWPAVGSEPPAGVEGTQLERWREALAGVERRLVDDRPRYQQLGIAFLTPHDPLWPFVDDLAPPPLLLARGDVELLMSPPNRRVAVVGTRRCTSVGRTMAFRIGSGLAAADCVVVSGLALGVDGAAHRGAMEAGGPVVGVVGTGLDVPYPKTNRQLWEAVISSGLLLSEFPLGTRPARWRFPARNRLIAGLASGVVVIESHAAGGALSTVEEAANRGRPVMAVPGSVLSPASDGTNALLVDGAVPVRNTADVLGHLGLEVPADSAATAPAPEHPQVLGVARDDFEALVFAEAATGVVHTDRLVSMSGLSVREVTVRLEALRAEGRIMVDGSSVVVPPTETDRNRRRWGR